MSTIQQLKNFIRHGMSICVLLSLFFLWILFFIPYRFASLFLLLHLVLIDGHFHSISPLFVIFISPCVAAFRLVDLRSPGTLTSFD